MMKNKVRPKSYEYDQLQVPASLTPDISSSSYDSTLSIRFSRTYLISILNSFKTTVNNTPLEKYEIDLYDISTMFNKETFAKSIDITCISKVHHLQKAANCETILEDRSEKKFESKIIAMLKLFPFILIQYKICASMLQLWDGLLIKWEILQLKNYDYRYSGRALNVRMIDLCEINKGIFNMDILWISAQIFNSPMNYLADSTLIEYARVLHDQFKKALKVFLHLNPKEIDPNYNIVAAVAYQSEKFWKWSRDECPNENLGGLKHMELKYVSGFSRCFASTDPKVEFAHNMLSELELAYRHFEKTLIGRILNITGNIEF